MAMSMADFENYMQRNAETKLTSVNDGLSELKTNVGMVDKSVKLNAKKIHKHLKMI